VSHAMRVSLSPIPAGNPIVIPSVEMDYRQATTKTSREVLPMFVDGNPAPTSGDLTWHFNNGLLDSNSLGILIDNTNSELVLPRTIGTDLSGNYTLEVSNNVGIATGSTHLLITCKYC